jgi:hypothetical protein
MRWEALASQYDKLAVTCRGGVVLRAIGHSPRLFVDWAGEAPQTPGRHGHNAVRRAVRVTVLMIMSASSRMPT